jgi:hypothetical protein
MVDGNAVAAIRTREANRTGAEMTTRGYVLAKRELTTIAVVNVAWIDWVTVAPVIRQAFVPYDALAIDVQITDLRTRRKGSTSSIVDRAKIHGLTN